MNLWKAKNSTQKEKQLKIKLLSNLIDKTQVETLAKARLKPQ